MSSIHSNEQGSHHGKPVVVVKDSSHDNSSHQNPYHVSGQSPTEVDRYSGHFSNDISQSNQLDLGKGHRDKNDPIRDQRTTATATMGEDTGTHTSTTNASSDKSRITATETETPGRKTVTVTEHVTK